MLKTNCFGNVVCMIHGKVEFPKSSLCIANREISKIIQKWHLSRIIITHSYKIHHICKDFVSFRFQIRHHFLICVSQLISFILKPSSSFKELLWRQFLQNILTLREPFYNIFVHCYSNTTSHQLLRNEMSFLST